MSRSLETEQQTMFILFLMLDERSAGLIESIFHRLSNGEQGGPQQKRFEMLLEIKCSWETP